MNLLNIVEKYTLYISVFELPRVVTTYILGSISHT
jgi:hypothetical protein